jgi:hypothetical protein
VPPKFSINLNKTHNMNLNENGELLVEITSKPVSKIKLIKDNKELIIKDRFKIETIDINENTKQYKLIIQDVQQNDQGHYKVEASNKCGVESTSTDLIIKGSYKLFNNNHIIKIKFLKSKGSHVLLENL